MAPAGHQIAVAPRVVQVDLLGSFDLHLDGFELGSALHHLVQCFLKLLPFHRGKYGGGEQ